MSIHHSLEFKQEEAEYRYQNRIKTNNFDPPLDETNYLLLPSYLLKLKLKNGSIKFIESSEGLRSKSVYRPTFTIKKKQQTKYKNLNKAVRPDIDNMKFPRLNTETNQVQEIEHAYSSKALIQKHVEQLSKRRASTLQRARLLKKFADSILEVEYKKLQQRNTEELGLTGSQFTGSQIANFQKRLSRVKPKKILEKKPITIQMDKPRFTKLKFKPKKTKTKQEKKQNYFEFEIFLNCILSLNRIKQIQHNSNRFRFYIGQGNNSFLIRCILRSRFWWIPTNVKSEANLIWTQNKNKEFVEKLQCRNPSQETDKEYEEISNQAYIQKDQVETENIDILKTLVDPIFQITQSKAIPMRATEQESRFRDHIYKFIKRSPEKCSSAEKFVKQMRKEEYDVLYINQLTIHNHLQCHWHLSNKKALFINLRRYYEQIQQDPFIHIPLTFHIKSPDDQQFRLFQQYFKNSKKTWIVKPGENTNRGSGINVSNSWDEIQKLTIGGCTYQRTVIIQQYIMPYLYEYRKFDIRCYMMVTSLNGSLKAYWYDEGYIRTSSKQFSLANLSNKIIHLTNDAIQKKGEQYGKYEAFNKLSFRQMSKYFSEHRRSFEIVQQQMKQLAADCIKATYKKLDPKKRDFTFEIFGLDFLVDSKSKTWLIEVNTNPCLQLSGSLLARIIPHMLQNSFRIAIDPLCTPAAYKNYKNWPINKRIQYSNKIFSNNKYELIFDQADYLIS